MSFYQQQILSSRLLELSEKLRFSKNLTSDTISLLNCWLIVIYMMNIPVNMSRTFERSVLNIFRHSSTVIKRVLDNATKDDHIHHQFALKQKAETIHHVLGIVML
jgi:hypothetical protein